MKLLLASFTLLLSTHVFAANCNVYIINLGPDYPTKVNRALESRGYKLTEDIEEATYTLGEFGHTKGIVWHTTAHLESIETKEDFTGYGKSIFSDSAFTKAIKQLPECI